MAIISKLCNIIVLPFDCEMIYYDIYHFLLSYLHHENNINNISDHLSPQHIEHQEKTTIYEIGNPCHGLVQTHSCGGVDPVSRLSVEIIQSNAIFFYFDLS